MPKLETHSGGHSIFKLVLEVVLISVGVFLGLAGEQWRENTSHRELAERTLLRFRAEIVENRKAVADVLAAVALYYGDMSVFEPRLLQLYDDLMPLIDKALGKAAPL